MEEEEEKEEEAEEGEGDWEGKRTGREGGKGRLSLRMGRLSLENS